MVNPPPFACTCLNIKIYPQPASDSVNSPAQHDPRASADLEQVYVGETGITVIYSELTLRSRSTPFVDNHGQKCQSVSVKCLACDVTVYRIKTQLSSNMDAKEGPLLPSEDWAEQDILKSRTGWIEVYGRNDNGNAKDVKMMPEPSRVFEIHLPDVDGHALPNAPKYLPQTRVKFPKDYQVLPTLPEFLPKPPFTPSHPIFRRLASVATSKSTLMRQEAVERCAAFAREQVNRLQEEEDKIKAELEQLWNGVSERLNKAEHERDEQIFRSLRHRKSESPVRTDGISSSLPALWTMRGFVPSTYHGPRIGGRAMSPNHASSRGGLASSIAVSTFHQSRSRVDNATQSSRPTANGREACNPSTIAPEEIPDTPSTLSSASISSDDSVDLPDTLRRNMNERIDISASLQVFSVLKEEVSKRQAHTDTQKSKGKAKEEPKVQNTSPKPNAPEISARSPSKEEQSLPSNASTVSQAGDSKSDKRERKRSGNKRVTFDVEPNVVTIKREITAENEDDTRTSGVDELIFELDEEPEATSSQVNGTSSARSLGSVNPANGPYGEFTSENSGNTTERNAKFPRALPDSFAALRPASLPASSHIRPPIRPHNSSGSRTSLHDETFNSRNERGKQGLNTFSNLALHNSVYERELRRLVGADVPSHRGSWSDSHDAWQRFQRGDRGSNSPAIMEEEENSVDNNTVTSWSEVSLAGIARSLPVPMAPISRHQEQKQPETTESQDDDDPQTSATASRLKAYAERDRKREFDPGYMDFLSGNLEGDEVDLSLNVGSELDGLPRSRSREQAFQILEARNRLPAEGIWRSLAS